MSIIHKQEVEVSIIHKIQAALPAPSWYVVDRRLGRYSAMTLARLGLIKKRGGAMRWDAHGPRSRSGWDLWADLTAMEAGPVHSLDLCVVTGPVVTGLSNLGIVESRGGVRHLTPEGRAFLADVAPIAGSPDMNVGAG